MRKTVESVLSKVDPFLLAADIVSEDKMNEAGCLLFFQLKTSVLTLIGFSTELLYSCKLLDKQIVQGTNKHAN